MQPNFDEGLMRINFDPEKPQAHLPKATFSAQQMSPEELLPKAIPWPAESAPAAAPLATTPDPSESLDRFKGYDAVVVTWTSAEAAALARLFTPGFPATSWYEYRHNVANYIPLVTGNRAPFNDTAKDMARYYHTLGLYFPCKIGKAKVLLFKSGLHLDYDGAAAPVGKLMEEINKAVNPKVFITTGTGGAIGKEVLLGDVVIAGHVKFDCTSQFKLEAWATSSFNTTALPAGTLDAITPAMTAVNASRVVGGRAHPKFWSGNSAFIVTTDFFGFDDSTDHYKLEGLGQACDMGDAMVAKSLHPFDGLKFFAIRNASDPQIPNPDNDIKKALKKSGEIYTKFGGLTTAASVIATWAVINKEINH